MALRLFGKEFVMLDVSSREGLDGVVGMDNLFRFSMISGS